MAREKLDRGESLNSSKSRRDDDQLELGGNEPPEPEILLSILNRKKNY